MQLKITFSKILNTSVSHFTGAQGCRFICMQLYLRYHNFLTDNVCLHNYDHHILQQLSHSLFMQTKICYPETCLDVEKETYVL